MDISQATEKVFSAMTKSKLIHEAVLIVENTEGDYSRCHTYGTKDADSPLLMSDTTRLFTSACVLALIDRGSLSPDDRVAQFFDQSDMRGLHVIKDRDYSNELTVYDLLFQTGGLPDYFKEGKGMKGANLRSDYALTFGELLEFTKLLQPHFSPRTPDKAYYADINFILLGEILERVTTHSLQAVYESLIFNPLHMEKTFLASSAADSIPGIYHKDRIIHRPRAVMGARAAGGCVTTARELMTFIKAFFGGGLFSKETLSKTAEYRRLFMSANREYYGGGYMRIPLGLTGKSEIVGHAGLTGSFAFWYPRRSFAFAGDLNQIADPALPVKLCERLASAVRRAEKD
ncbi:MAG: serine hydrolase [Eubacteriales bacterium]|nr:serine hydrolase [Eubacteriales bacterium]